MKKITTAAILIFASIFVAFNILTNPCIFKSEEIVPKFFETSKEFSKNIIDLTGSEKEKMISIIQWMKHLQSIYLSKMLILKSMLSI